MIASPVTSEYAPYYEHWHSILNKFCREFQTKIYNKYNGWVKYQAYFTMSEWGGYVEEEDGTFAWNSSVPVD
jgi:coproporphyrinogen III oxidase